MTDHVTTQSTVVATLPDGTQIAVDQLPTGELVQYVKRLDATNDSVNAAAVTAAGALKVDPSAVTQPVSAAALPLPAGAATGAKQDTGNVSLASIDTKNPALGQALAAASVPVVLTAIQQAALTPPAAIVGFALDASLATLDADLKAEIGAVSGTPGAYTVLDRLAQNTLKIDTLTKTVATEVTMKKLLAALSKPVTPSYSTLLHR